MKKQDKYNLFERYLKNEMNDKEIDSFEKILLIDTRLQKEFLMNRAIFIAAGNLGKEETLERFKSLELERSKIVKLSPEKSNSDIAFQWIKKAAFMHETEIGSSSLPISEETIIDFMQGEDD